MADPRTTVGIALILAAMLTTSAHDSEPVGDEDHRCGACGCAPTSVAIPPVRTLVPDQIERTPAQTALLPAVRADLAPFAPALRSVAAVLATAALTDWAARYAAPALARKSRELVRSKRQPQRITRTTMIEQHITVRHWVSVRS